MKDKIVRSIGNFEKALNKLHEFTDEPVITDRDRAGVIQGFEFTFEISWRIFQKIAKYEHMEIGGPKTSLKQAFTMDLIENEYEELWLKMLEDRNIMSHTYREEMSREVAQRVQGDVRCAFDRLLEKLKSRYLK